MKKILIIVIACLFSVIAMAQEKEEKRLELKNGTVLTGYVEVQQDGSYLLETSAGDVFFFTPSEVARVMAIVPSAQSTNYEIDYYGGKTVEKRKGKIYMLSTGEELSQKDFMNYQGWEKYQKAQRQSKIGTILFISAGGAVVAGALVGTIITLGSEIKDPVDVAIGALGGAVYVGVPCIIGGVVFKAIGNKQLKKIEQSYNQTPGYVLDFGAQQNGIGFALKF